MTTKSERIYQEIMRDRKDMTAWLVHFTRRSDTKSALNVLFRILAQGVLKPGFSYRNGNRTVYGPTKAVCFSEQPLSAFATYVKIRNEPDMIDGYGLILHKHDVSAAGGLPVISGLRDVTEVHPSIKLQNGFNEKDRILDASNLPFNEQFRYVAFVPRANHSIDWSHEREWRWPADTEHARKSGFYLLGGNYSGTRGRFASRVHAIVKYDQDIALLQNAMKQAIAMKKIGNVQLEDDEEPYSEEWMKHLKKIRIMSLESFSLTNELRFDEIDIDSLPFLVV
jgi:hypothetical protein